MADDPPDQVLSVLAVVPDAGAVARRPAVAGGAGPVISAELGSLAACGSEGELGFLAARGSAAELGSFAARGSAAEPAARRVGPLSIDPAARRVTLAGRPLVLTRREYDLLAHLATAPGRVFTKQELLHAIWSEPTGPPTRRLDAQVARLRRRLGDHRALLVTVWGVGYRLAVLDSP